MVGESGEAEPENVSRESTGMLEGGLKFFSEVSSGDVRGLRQIFLTSPPLTCQPTLRLTCSLRLRHLPLSVFCLRPVPSALGACAIYVACAQGGPEVSVGLMTPQEQTPTNAGQGSEGEGFVSPSLDAGTS